MRHGGVVHAVKSTILSELAAARMFTIGHGQIFFKQMVDAEFLWVKTRLTAEGMVEHAVVDRIVFNLRSSASVGTAWRSLCFNARSVDGRSVGRGKKSGES